MRKRRKKRSLRGKALILFVCVLACCFFLILLKATVSIFSKNEGIVPDQENAIQSSMAEAGFLGNRAEAIIYENKGSASPGEKPVSLEKEKDFVRKMCALPGMVPYAKSSHISVNTIESIQTDGLSKFGLVEYAYLCASGKDLYEQGINEGNFTRECKEIAGKDLNIGDIGVGKINNVVLYGVYIGKYGNYPLFVYTCDLPDIGYENGRVYISYNKNECNDLFANMYPMPFEKFYRLPGIEYQPSSEYEITEYLNEDILPDEEYSTNAAAVYRIGEWIRSKESSKLIERMNADVLSDLGFYIDETVFQTFIEHYGALIGNNEFIFRMISYNKYSSFTTVHGEVVTIGNGDNKDFNSSNLYFDCTIYEDGSYIPGTEFTIGKYAILYGLTNIRVEEEDETGISDIKQTTITPGVTEGEPVELSETEEEETNTFIRGVGFTIDISQKKSQ